MSDIQQLIQGKMTPSAFIAKEVAYIENNPFVKFVEPLAIEALNLYLTMKIGGTAAGIITTDIEDVLAGSTSQITGDIEAALVALIKGLLSGQSGSATGQQVIGSLTGGGTTSA